MRAAQSAAPQLHRCCTKAGNDNAETSEHGPAPKNPLFTKTAGQVWPLSLTSTPGPANTKVSWSAINTEVNYAEKQNLLMKENELAKV